jgi:hypothetical protein
MPQRSYTKSVGNQSGRFWSRLLFGALVLAALLLLSKFYLAQEVLVVVLLVALLMMVALVFSMAFVLFQAGVRQVIVWGKTGVARFTGVSHRPVTPGDSIVHPTLPR